MESLSDGRIDLLLRCLSDPTRRRILTDLAERPGATTSWLTDRSPGLTRWAVMKHLAALRGAGLIETLPEGRRRRHFRADAALQPLRDWLETTLSERGSAG